MTVHLVISGHVQGVFFRAETKRVADSLFLSGWVRNLSNGDVETYAIGDKKKLEKFVQWCQHGPSRAQVENVNVEWNKDLGKESSFRIIL